MNSFQGPSEFTTIYPVILHLNDEFNESSLLDTDVLVDQSLTLFKGCLYSNRIFHSNCYSLESRHSNFVTPNSICGSI